MKSSKKLSGIFELMKRNGIPSQQKLLIQILTEIGCSDPLGEAEKEKGNFSKMISGERPLKIDYVAPMERILNASLSEILSGKKVPIPFQNKGIRYAAFTDDKNEYEQLYKEDALNCFDEFNQSALDYIFSYHAINGLRFLVEKESLQLDFNGRFLTGNVVVSGNLNLAAKNVLSLVCEKGDYPLFEAIFSAFSRIGLSGGQKGILTDEDSMKMILCSKKIFEGLLTGKEIKLNAINYGLVNDKDSGFFVNPLLFDLANYVLQNEKEFPEQAKELLEYGIKENQISKDYFDKHFGESDGLQVSDEGLITLGRTIYGSLLITKLVSQPDLSESSFNLLNKLNEGINTLSFKSKPLLGGFSGSKVRIENGLLVKTSTNNKAEYDFLELMKKNNVSFIPQLVKKDNGFDYFTYFPGIVPGAIKKESMARLTGIARALRKLNDISKKSLGNGKVYVHNDFSVMNMVFDGEKLVGIIDWDKAKIGEDYEDFIYLLWTGLNIGNYLRNDEEIFQSIKELLKAYGATPSFKKGWAEKMLSVMDNRLERCDRSNQDYTRVFEWVGWSKVFVELYREKIGKEIGE